MPQFKSESDKVFKSFGSQSVIVCILGIIGLAYFSVMSHLLSKEDFGLFAVIMAITSILTEISNAGLGSAVIQKKDADSGFINTSFTLSIIVGSIFFVLLFLSADNLSLLLVKSQAITFPLKLTSITVLLYNINSILRALYMRELEFLKYGKIQIASLFIAYSIGVILAAKGYGLFSIVWAMVLNIAFLCILLLINNKYSLSFQIHKKYIKEIVTFGGWLTMSGIVRCIYEQLDKLITAKWLSVAELGSYNRPTGFVNQVSGQVNGIFDTILFPILSDIQKDEEKIKSAYRKAVNLTVLFAVIFAYFFVLASYVLIDVFLGDKWISLIPIFDIASITMIFMFYGRIGDSFFRSLGIVKSYFFVRLTICILAIGFIVLGCKFGIIGLAFAVSVSKLSDCIIKAVILRKRIAIPFKCLFADALKSIWLPTIVFLPLFYFASIYQGAFSSVLASVCFILIIAVFCIKNPFSLGSNFYTYVLSKVIK